MHGTKRSYDLYPKITQHIIHQGADTILKTNDTNALTHLHRNCPSNDGACTRRAEHISVLDQSSFRKLWPQPGGITSELVSLKVQVEVESQVPWRARWVGCSAQLKIERTFMIIQLQILYTQIIDPLIYILPMDMY